MGAMLCNARYYSLFRSKASLNTLFSITNTCTSNARLKFTEKTKQNK